eukprot:1075045-Amphidinium_carterae.2
MVKSTADLSCNSMAVRKFALKVPQPRKHGSAAAQSRAIVIRNQTVTVIDKMLKYPETVAAIYGYATDSSFLKEEVAEENPFADVKMVGKCKKAWVTQFLKSRCGALTDAMPSQMPC